LYEHGGFYWLPTAPEIRTQQVVDWPRRRFGTSTRVGPHNLLVFGFGAAGRYGFGPLELMLQTGVGISTYWQRSRYQLVGAPEDPNTYRMRHSAEVVTWNNEFRVSYYLTDELLLFVEADVMLFGAADVTKHYRGAGFDDEADEPTYRQKFNSTGISLGLSIRY
jgi:hypothetical protein